MFLRLFKRFFLIRVRGGFRVRVRVGDSFRVRDRVSLRAKGWVSFMYYGPKLFKLNSLWRRIRKVKQNRAGTQSFCPNWVLHFIVHVCF